MTRKTNLKKTFFIIAVSLIFASVKADITFQFTANTYLKNALKERIENNISRLLTEIDRAGNDGADLNLSGIDMQPEAKSRLMGLWEDARFVCRTPKNISNCLEDKQGYQVRNIRIKMKPYDNTYEGSLDRELTISIGRTGQINGVRIAMDKHDVNQILSGGTGVEDVRARREILKWVEDFRCYYNEKNIKALQQIYSDQALIITGSVMKVPVKSDYGVRMENKVKFRKEDKAQYLTRLSGIFKRNSRINVQFSDISIVRHGAKPNIYGVTLFQKWQAGSYHDEGWLFLVWDFTDEDQPQIYVRSWQPEDMVNQFGVMELSDFDIY
ncbi:MAG: nuclear transport factor 2 family protein [Paramuribaculum sp.]|nr:nuclear transport factor 2 family protein [Paramuribaculum sp.]